MSKQNSEPMFPLPVEHQKALYSISKRIHDILEHPTAPVTAFEMFELGDVLKMCCGEHVSKPFDSGRFEL